MFILGDLTELSFDLSNKYLTSSIMFIAGDLTELSFDLSNKYLISSGDKHIIVLHNITGFRATITELENTEKKATTQAQKERIRQQISDARYCFKTYSLILKRNPSGFCFFHIQLESNLPYMASLYNKSLSIKDSLICLINESCI